MQHPRSAGRHLSIGGSKVATARAKASEGIGLAQNMTVDNSPEFAGNVLDQWAYGQGIELYFIRPGKPVKNSYIEGFNRRLCDELSNTEIFFTLTEVKVNLKSGGLIIILKDHTGL